jgi:cytochrome P450
MPQQKKPSSRRLAQLMAHLTGSGAAIDEDTLFSMPHSSTTDATTLRFPGFPGPAHEDAAAYHTHVHHYLMDLHEKYGDQFVITREGKPVVFVRDPASVRAVLLSEDFEKTWDADSISNKSVDYVMNLVQPVLTNTVFNAQGEQNFESRRMLRPMFLAFNHFLASWSEVTEQEVSKWNGVMDIQDASHNLLRKTIFTVLCGDNCEYAYKSIETFHEVMNHFVERYSVVSTKPEVTQVDEEMMKRLYEASLAVVLDFRARQAANENLSEAVKKSLVWILIQNDYGNEEIAATLVNVMIAAGEAPASALAQTLEEIANNTPVQQRMHEEVRRCCGDDGDVKNSLGEMAYIDGVAKEGLRMFAPATLVQRQATCDTELNGVKLPKGQVVGLCVSAIHMDGKQWEAPEVFNPERPGLNIELMGEDRVFLTFSGGPRGCPGRHLALTIVKVALATVARKFSLFPMPQTSAKVPKFVEWSCTGIPLMLRRREFDA